MEEIKEKKILFDLNDISQEKLIKFIFYLLIFYTLSPFGSIISAEDLSLTILYYSAIVKISGILIITLFIILVLNYKNNFPSLTVKEKLPNYFFFAFFILTLVSNFLAEDIALTFFGNFRCEGYITYIAYAGIFIGGYVVSRNDSNSIKKLTKFMVISSLVFSLIGLADNFVTNIYGIYVVMPRSAFVNPNFFGHYTAITLILSINLLLSSEKISKIIFFFITSLVITFALVVTRCRSAWLGFAIGFLCYCVFQIKVLKNKQIKKIAPLVIIFAVAAFVFINLLSNWYYLNATINMIKISLSYIKDPNLIESTQYSTDRWILWKSAIQFIKEKPLFGYGLDNLSEKFTNILGYPSDRAHNEILQLAATIGIPATVCYLVGVCMIIVRATKKISKANGIEITIFCVSITYLIISLLNNSTPFISPYFYLFLGALFAFGIKNFSNNNI